jgi:hypothetical protein
VVSSSKRGPSTAEQLTIERHYKSLHK